ncbi:hypothetical protein MAR_009466 [Mya arenaria]|uniref:Uncharacterized protein n=2 Tax=Mya arenaria TaxID=6604 RepID=A0ABY7DYT9_MYAAR|nr:hypothetical protein MAR_009463 [Mya arenaria]WAR02908.1 hypothetical protein MAR_009466 [Mya arenaria]
MKPVYAHEIEPGIVVLQNENGDYFKILKEYDMKGGNQYGSLSCTKPEMTQPNRETEMLSSLPQSSCQPRDFPLHASAPPCLNDEVNSRMLERRSNGAEFRSVDFNLGSGTNPPPYGVP